MTVRKRGAVWHYEFMQKGRRYYGSLPGCASKQEAEIAEGAAKHEAFLGRLGKPDPGPTLEAFVRDTYIPWARENKKSWTSDVNHLKPLCAAFGKKRLTEITSFMVERYKSTRLKAPTRGGGDRAPASVNLELMCLSKVFSLARVSPNPVHEVKKYRLSNERYKYLSYEDEPRLLAELPGRLRPLVIVAIDTGGRRGELLALTQDNVLLSQNSVRFVDTKNGKDRSLPLTPRAATALQCAMAGHSGADPVFPVGDFNHAWLGALKRAGIEGLHFHDLRHTFATRLAESGVDLYTIQRLLGHKSVAMSGRYAHLTDRSARDAISRLGLRQGVDNLVEFKVKG